MPVFSPSQLYTSNNQLKATSLVRELCRSDEDAIMTLSFIRDDLPSLPKLYIQYCVDDPTEVTFAEEVFGSMHFWLNFRTIPRLQPHLEKWREICEEKRKSNAFKAIVNEAKEGGATGLNAAKFLIQEPWKDKRSTAERTKAKKTAEKAYSTVSEDWERLQKDLLN